MLTHKEQQQLEIAKCLPADVLALAAIHQAENNMLTERWCNDVGDKWHEAAEIARNRRLFANRPDAVFSIAGV